MLERQSLYIEVDPTYDLASYASNLSNNGNREMPTYSRISAASLRLQRQANARRHCSSSHLQDVSELVQRMIEDENQCDVCQPSSHCTSSETSSSSAEEDEGVNMKFADADMGGHRLLGWTSGERATAYITTHGWSRRCACGDHENDPLDHAIVFVFLSHLKLAKSGRKALLAVFYFGRFLKDTLSAWNFAAIWA
ncbi:hypothetical protein M011DRAFT_464313 [Sporormia fimetaria CBS 119925]|uniref:Uncharacterized protein n=1 Tax=Sporormia fimetaria CBS 119925 TaxID=1340428 RepID=A0A6A6VQQ6_9PLEO|nr:hypothetical protein M011DRAFT_464313 [Sporormia fimetaria CBS 119925]